MDLWTLCILAVMNVVVTSGLSFTNFQCNNGYVIAMVGKDLTIDCRTTDSNSTSAIYYNNKPIHATNTGSVYIIKVTLSGRGSYKCVANSPSSGQNISKECTIIPYRPVSVQELPNPVVNSRQFYPSGQDFNLTCTIKYNLNVQLEFYKIVGGKSYRLTNVTRGIKSLTLQFINPSAMLPTVYMCRAKSVMEIKDTYAKIAIKDPEPVRVTNFPETKFLALKPNTRITCSGTGFPLPTNKLYKDGKRLYNTQKCPPGSNILCLTIPSPVYPDDQGNYSCVASNELGDTSTKSFFAVFQFPPKIDGSTKEVITSGNKDHNLTCNITNTFGQIPPTFKWFQNPCNLQKHCKAKGSKWRPVSLDYKQLPSRNTPTFTSTITVPSTFLSATSFKCIATNSLGKDSHVIAFHRAKVDKPKVEIKGQTLYNEEEVLVFTCVVSVGKFHKWSKDGVKIHESRRVQMVSRTIEGIYGEKVTLKILNITVRDSGRYACKGMGLDGSKISNTKTVIIKEVFNPNITELSNITANYYNNNETSVEVTCHVIANPKPIIEWKRQGSKLILERKENCKNIVSGYYLKNTPDGSDNILLICGAKSKYSGWFTCVAKNSKGSDMKSAYIDVLSAPKISSSLQYKIKYKAIGEPLTIHCQATGNPTPVIVWGTHAKNRSILQEKRQSASSIHISRIQKEDYGNFTCVAINSRGSDRMVVDVRHRLVNAVKQTASDERILLFGAIGGSLGFLFCLVVFVCCLMNRRQKRLLEEYKAIKYLRSGQDYKLDPERTILEQCEDLPYDTDWEFPVKRLLFQGIIGSGNFGQVMRADAIGILSFSARDKTSDAFRRRSRLRRRLSSSRLYQDSTGNDYAKTTVAVKMLKAEANESDYKDLATELKIMIHLGEHTNIVNLLGACTRTKQLMVILEFAPHGNLLNFLRSRREIYEPTWRKTANNPDAEFTLADLVMYSYQIARGMDFLSSKKCVHRDLAARNVLVGHDYVMKISDFGLARDIYKSDLYVKKTTGLLPVKWMAPESLFDRIYTQKTDVWSFGVTLWETQTLGGTPYPGIPVEDLMDYLSEGKRMRQPIDCPPEIYAIMRDCWLPKAIGRPTFSELVRRIERIIEKKISKQEADDAYISVFMDEDLHRIYYLDPKDASSLRRPRDDGLQSLTEDEIKSSPLPPVPCLSLQNIYKPLDTNDALEYCHPVDDKSSRYTDSPLSPSKSPANNTTQPIFNFEHQNPSNEVNLINTISEKRISGSSTGVESGIEMDESQMNDNSLPRKDNYNLCFESRETERTSLLNSSKLKEKTKESIL